MSKWFEVPIRIDMTVLVEVEDDEGKDEAAEIALEAVHINQEAEVLDDEIVELTSDEADSHRCLAYEIFDLR